MGDHRQHVLKRPFGFAVVVDEAHRGMATARSTRDTIVTQIIGGGATSRPAIPVVWGISATPQRFLSAMSELGRSTRPHTVRIEDVRASGLLKDQIILGHTRGVDAAESTLVRHAVKRVREYDRKWADYTSETGEPPVHPALVVQVADKPTTKELGDLVGTILQEWPEVTPVNIVHTFADHTHADAGTHQIAWCPPEDIQDRHDIRVVLCKTAITTGWDCPRAEVLLSLRVARDIDLITQVMGRMVRTPLARRITTDADLNAVHCILPKFDQDAVVDRVSWTTPQAEDEIDFRVVVNPTQAATLLRSVGDIDPAMVGFFACMYYAALRPGEVLHLRQQDCTLPKLPETGWGELVLTGSTQYTGSSWGDNGKSLEDRALKHRASRSTRRVPVCPELVRILRYHLDTFTCGLDGRLFVTRTGAGRHPVTGGFAGPVSGSSYGGTWRKARTAALTTAEGASPLARRPYDLRHACVSLWLNAGVPATQVAEWAGHSVAVLLRVYAKCIAGQEDSARQRVDAALRT